MSLYDWLYSRQLKKVARDPPFYALLYVLIERADTVNTAKIKALWPEAERRYLSTCPPGSGVLPEDEWPEGKPIPEVPL